MSMWPNKSDDFGDGWKVPANNSEGGDPYLKGRTTKQLVDDLWDAVLPAWMGSSLAVCAPILWAAFFLHTFPWDEPYSPAVKIISGIVALCLMAGGVYLSVPWFQIRNELRRRRGA